MAKTMTIQEAYEKVAAVVPPDKSITIQLDCWWHSFSNQREGMEAGWLISYVDGPLYRGNTLDAAVGSFLNAETVPPASLEETQEVITASALPEG